MTRPLRVLLLAAEAAPWAKSGGLGDVVGALLPRLRKRGVDARLLMPCYGWIPRQDLSGPQAWSIRFGGETRQVGLRQLASSDLPVYLLECKSFYDRPYLYGPPGESYDDNAQRFALLNTAAIELGKLIGWWPDVFHCHDWQTALLPIYLNTRRLPQQLSHAATLFTIHNIAYQGWFSTEQLRQLELGGANAEHLGLARDNAINLMAGAVQHATILSTVSPHYAKQIQADQYGEGLQHLLRSRATDLFGVLNGIDQTIWNPRSDRLLPKTYDKDALSGKAFCKAELQRQAGLPAELETPLIGVVSRIDRQKGSDLIIEAADEIAKIGAQLVVLGSGQPELERAFAQVAQRLTGRFKVWLEFDEARAHLIEAGSDLFLMPSRWEPCGLNQMYSQRYGTLPIVRATGGLVDTVRPLQSDPTQGTGFLFGEATAEAMLGAVRAATDMYRKDKTRFREAIARAMTLDHSWTRASATYEYLYRLAVVRRHGG
ncbi:MAG: glycogen synthase GlgA [Deltaproteobacteria bacterium]|nr:glycogen synthase GlgA [Deltaproteobacteria bacterium]